MSLARTGRPLARQKEKVKTAVLAVLVGLSFFLSTRLWLETPGGGPPALPRPYVAGGNAPEASLAEVLVPRRVVVHRTGRHALLADPGQEAFRAAVTAAAGALATAARQGASPTPAASSELAAFRKAGAGLDLVLPAELPASEWLAAWSGEAAARGLSRAGASRVPARRIALFVASEGQAVLFLEGARGWMRLSAGDGEPLRETLDRMTDVGEGVDPFAGRWVNLKVPGDIFAPAAPRFARLSGTWERLNADRLAGSFFPDPGVVRRVDGQDGTLLLTDGQQGLRIGADGSVRFDGPQVAARKGPEASLLAAAREAVAFVASHGGWPQGVRLLALHPEPDGARLEFAPAFGGYPLLGFRPGTVGEAGPAAASAPVSLTASAPGGVSAYRRALPIVSGGQPHESVLPAARALAAVDAAWPGLSGGAGQPGLVTDIYPAYLAGQAPDGGGATFRPAWVVELDGGRRVAVDAVTGQVVAGIAPAQGEG